MWRLLAVCLFMISMAMAENDIWEEYKEKYDLSFGDDEGERLAIFKQNRELIELHNAEADRGKHTYWLAVNQFAHMTNKEFAESNNVCRPHLFRNTTKWAADYVHKYDPTKTLPVSVDWREKGYVTPIKNQGQCGSCWAFSTTGSLEGQVFNKTGKLVSLSEKQLVDCSGKFGNHGCNGGLMDNAFAYIKKYGIDSEGDYTYKGRNGKCIATKVANAVASVTGFADVQQGDEHALKSAVATVGPISVAIDASHFSFQFYHEGVYDESMCSSSKLDHGVLVVGYAIVLCGTNQGKDYCGTNQDKQRQYWIVKNSWGPGWGMDGYIMMARNKNNQCGIATAASYPLV